MKQAEGGWGEISSAKGLGDADPVEVPFGGVAGVGRELCSMRPVSGLCGSRTV